jgi:hypothetical protein
MLLGVHVSQETVVLLIGVKLNGVLVVSKHGVVSVGQISQGSSL